MTNIRKIIKNCKNKSQSTENGKVRGNMKGKIGEIEKVIEVKN